MHIIYESASLTCNTTTDLLSNAICDLTCPKDFYVNVKSFICESYQSLCLKCSRSSDNDCTSCNTTTYPLPNGTCDLTCPHYY